MRERHSLVSDTPFELLKARGVTAALGGFSPRSTGEQEMALDPDATSGTVLSLFDGFERLWAEHWARHEELVLRRGGVVVFLTLRAGHADIQVLAEDFSAKGVLEEFLKRLKPFEFRNREEDGVWAEFVHRADHGVSRSNQFLRCPSWREVGANYPSPVRDAVASLLQMRAPWRNGRLVIWHGPPGAGKTWAIRALMMEWKSQFDYRVVNDPERLVADPSYYYELASDSDETPDRVGARVTGAGGSDEPGTDGDRRRRLFILEDTADLILQESRSSHYDKIGKLLNMTDGIFGQGREDVFLLTFNEEVERIDPAFLRPGRCAGKVEFRKFSRSESTAWLRDHGIEEAPRGEMSLAELYARLSGANVEPREERRLGFAGAGR